MSRPEFRPEFTDDFRDLFHETVDHVEPRPGLDAIRSRIDAQENAMSPRLKFLAPLAAAAAVAAIAGGFLLTSGGDPGGNPDLPPATSPSASDSPSPSPSPSPSSPSPSSSPSSTPDPAPSGETRAMPVYFVGDTPYGPRLYREFHRVEAERDWSWSLTLAVGGGQLDPDYRSPWPVGTKVLRATADADQITIDLQGDLHDRPAGMSEAEASMAVEQLIYTAQAAYGKGRLPVQLLLDGSRTDTVLGVPTSEPLANGNPVETLSLVNLSSPGQGTVVTGDTLEVTGVANSFEANVPLRILQGSKVLWRGFTTAEGCCEEKLFPFAHTIDVSELAPGTYVLEAMTDDPSGGAEGNGPYVDTRQIEIR